MQKDGGQKMNHDTIINLLNRVREKKTLIHNITNIVVANFTANGLLALGASPFMASAKEEVAEAAKISDAVVLNFGAIGHSSLSTLKTAGQSANLNETLLVFDPVGVGATSYRNSAAVQLLSDLRVDFIRGNAGEIAQLAGFHAEVKGVDVGNITGDPQEWVKTVAEQYRTVAIATGKTDVVSDGKRTFAVHNGHEMLTKVTGTGCLLSTVVGAFAAVATDRLEAAVAALTVYGIAAELASEGCEEKGPGSFQVAFINMLGRVSAAEIKQYGSFEQLDEGEGKHESSI